MLLLANKVLLAMHRAGCTISGQLVVARNYQDVVVLCCAVHSICHLHHSSLLHVGEAYRHPLQAQLYQAAIKVASWWEPILFTQNLRRLWFGRCKMHGCKRSTPSAAMKLNTYRVLTRRAFSEKACRH